MRPYRALSLRGATPTATAERELPNLYSHYGSRGIVLMTILQSWSQGVEVWGRDGMSKLWSASNIKVYGEGVAEAQFLNEIAQFVGEYATPT